MLQSRCLTLLAALAAFGASMVIMPTLISKDDDDVEAVNLFIQTELKVALQEFDNQSNIEYLHKVYIGLI